MNSRTLAKIVAVALLIVALVSVATWYFTRETLPDSIRIATSSRGSYYFDVGSALARFLELSTDRSVEVVQTAGSLDNLRLLADGDVHLAMVEASALPVEGIGVVAPLFPEVVHIVVRRQSGIGSIAELAGKRVVLGEPGSAMRRDALNVLEHYRLADDMDIVSAPFESLLTDASIDAAIVTTGLVSPMLGPLWDRTELDVLAIEDAAAISLTHMSFFEATIPRGLYHERPPIPARDTPTVATTALLVARDDVSAPLVHRTLDTLYESDLPLQFTSLIKAGEAREWSLVALHATTRSYFRPYEGLDLLSSFMESLAATKELLFAVAAGLYLTRNAYRRMKSREDQEALQELKDHLDTYLDETIRIERAQMETDDPVELEGYLDEVTGIKLRALEELSHEDLRGDRTFLIFLTQCANLIAKIQSKLELVRR